MLSIFESTMFSMVTVIDDEDRKLLLDMRKLLDELLETLDVASNRKEIEAIEEAEKELAEGKGRPLSEFVDELKRKGEV